MTLRARLVDAEERMDAPDAPPADLEHALDDLVGVGRWLGARRAVRRHLGAFLPPRDRPYRILDVGVGGGELTRVTATALARSGVRLVPTGLDLHPTTLRLARSRGTAFPLVRGDARRLPFADGAFDAAVCATTLHHFDDPAARRVIAEMARVSRVGIVVSDLRRGRAAYIGARLLAATAWRSSPFTRHDGPLSVRRAFRREELERVAEEAGLHGARVVSEPVFRLSLVWTR